VILKHRSVPYAVQHERSGVMHRRCATRVLGMNRGPGVCSAPVRAALPFAAVAARWDRQAARLGEASVSASQVSIFDQG
jgi:hypothetical protein